MCKVINVLFFFLVFNFVAIRGILSSENGKEDEGEPLILTPLITEGKIEEARLAAKVNLNDSNHYVSYSGYLTVDEEHNSNIFFWFFQSTTKIADPVILWLEGGLGPSSMGGLFVQHGPYHVTKRNSLIDREYTWVESHSVIYMDSPVGTGFSFTNDGYVTNVNQTAEHLYNALLQFFQLFPDLQNNDFFIAGQNYAGKDIPVLGYLISTRNPTAALKINLKGMSIAYPLSDPVNQMTMGNYLYEHGLIDNVQLKKYLFAEQLIRDLINIGDHKQAHDTYKKLISFFHQCTNLDRHYRNNIFRGTEEINIKRKNYLDFIDQPRIRKGIHIGDTEFDDNKVMENLFDDYTKSVAPYIDLLLPNYRMLFYTGQLTALANYASVNNFLQQLDYSKDQDYSNKKVKRWVVSRQKVGFKRVMKNLINIVVENSGSTISDIRPDIAYEMIYAFTRNYLK